MNNDIIDDELRSVEVYKTVRWDEAGSKLAPKFAQKVFENREGTTLFLFLR
jgi:hypothetical protein